MKARLRWRGHSKTEDVTVYSKQSDILLLYQKQNTMAIVRINMMIIVRYTMMFVNCTGYTRLMSKTNCPVKPLHASLASREHRGTQSSLNVLLSEGGLSFPRTENNIVSQVLGL